MADDETRQAIAHSWHGPQDERRERNRARLPALTVLYHPDPRRVGERVVLRELATGMSVALSRTQPRFATPGEPSRRPLDDVFLSRKPVRLTHAVPSGAVPSGAIRLATAGSPTSVTADGVRVNNELILKADDVERGVVLEIGNRVVLLLHLLGDFGSTGGQRHGLVGDSDAMGQLHQEIGIVADLNLPVLLRGETGTGKELVAHSIHNAGKHHDAPFLGLNMGAVTPSLAASELFGSAKGAFTGSIRSQRGYFQRADGGTLFLDEIGETPVEVQVMLLRVLETGEVQQVGGQQPQKVNVRLIAATDADLSGAIEAGRFREPLLHRLAGYEISIPPLRERRDDIGRLLFHFLRQELRAVDEEYRLDPVAPEASPWMPLSIVARLARYDWPGNVRQLRNVARQMVVSSRGADVVQVPAQVERLLRDATANPTIVTAAPETSRTKTPNNISAAQNAKSPPSKQTFRKPSEVTEDELIEALKANDWELKPTAAELRISRGSLYNLIAKNPRIRKASDLSHDEIVECHRQCEGDLNRMVERLEISRSGLQMRMRALGID